MAGKRVGAVMAVVALVVAAWLRPSVLKAPFRAIGLLSRAFSHQDAGYFAAGVLVVARNPVDNAVYVLLGLDYHTGLWADFGGLRDEHELEPLTTACRELWEETSHMLPAASTVDSCRAYVPKCTTVRFSYEVTSRNAHVHQYVVVVPYDAQLPTNLLPARGLYQWIFMPFSGEKTELQWIKASDLQQATEACCKSDHAGSCSVNGLPLRGSFVQSLCTAHTLDPYELDAKVLSADCFGPSDENDASASDASKASTNAADAASDAVRQQPAASDAVPQQAPKATASATTEPTQQAESAAVTLLEGATGEAEPETTEQRRKRRQQLKQSQKEGSA